MLIRFQKLRLAVEQYLQDEDLDWLSIAAQEWNKITYLISLARPFAICTALISRTKGPSVHLVFPYYNMVFDLIERAKALLSRKRVPWKKDMRSALSAAEDKLKKYYSQTEGGLGDIYGVAALLNPLWKDEIWETSAWKDEPQWKTHYWRKLQGYWQRRIHPNPNALTGEMLAATPQQQSKKSKAFTISDFLRAGAPSRHAANSTEMTEFERYRAAGKYK